MSLFFCPRHGADANGPVIHGLRCDCPPQGEEHPCWPASARAFKEWLAVHPTVRTCGGQEMSCSDVMVCSKCSTAIQIVGLVTFLVEFMGSVPCFANGMERLTVIVQHREALRRAAHNAHIAFIRILSAEAVNVEAAYKYEVEKLIELESAAIGFARAFGVAEIR